MISEIDIRCFLELVKTLNFTVAAENLYMTQQCVSKHILALENDLGVPLFVRTRKVVLLTEEGAKFNQLFSSFRNDYENCLLECRRITRIKKGQLKVGYQNWIYYGETLRAANEAMSAKFPSFNLSGEMHSARNLHRLLSSGYFDMIIIYRRLAGDVGRFMHLLLKEVSVMLMISKKRVETAENVDFSAFAVEPLIIDEDELEYQWGDHDPNLPNRFGIIPSEIIVRPNRDSVYLSVELGQGITLGSNISQIKNREIECFPVGYMDELICLWRQDTSSDIMQTFAICLQDAFCNEKY